MDASRAFWKREKRSFFFLPFVFLLMLLSLGTFGQLGCDDGTDTSSSDGGDCSDDSADTSSDDGGGCSDDEAETSSSSSGGGCSDDSAETTSGSGGDCSDESTIVYVGSDGTYRDDDSDCSDDDVENYSSEGGSPPPGGGGGGGGPPPPPPPSDTPFPTGLAMELVSPALGGAGGTGGSHLPAASEDGRYVVFESDATNLMAGDSNEMSDIFFYDRKLELMVLVSRGWSGGSNGTSGRACISADGRYVAYRSDASNLVSEDPNGELTDVFLFDRQSGTTELASLGVSGAGANGQSVAPSISADGRYVAFESSATNLTPGGDLNGSWGDIFVYDRDWNSVERVTLAPGGTAPNGDSRTPSISGDGEYVVFDSTATNLIATDGNGFIRDVFVYDRGARTFELVSLSPDGNGGSGDSEAASLSADGRYVAFESTAGNLTPSDKNGVVRDIFLYDRQMRSVSLVSASLDSNGAAGDSRFASVSSDGRWVAFESVAGDLVPRDEANTSDAFVYDRVTRQVVRISTDFDPSSPDGDMPSGQSHYPRIAAGGRYVVFQSQATDLIPYDPNGAIDDVFAAPNPPGAP
ncbi:MAG: hypothetical protein AB1405_05310 [Bdellovibrionota bacterium]